jgi:CheY-like chemotaxis protein
MSAAGTWQAERVVLVVEDDELVRYFMVRSLAEGGFRAVVASNGGEALRILAMPAATVISAVVTDLAMPVMDGRTLAERMAEKWPSIPLLMVSAQAPLSWEGPFLAKPFSPPDLVAAVEGLLPPAPKGVGVA